MTALWPGCLQVLHTMSLVQDDARCPLVKHLEQVAFSGLFCSRRYSVAVALPILIFSGRARPGILMLTNRLPVRHLVRPPLSSVSFHHQL